MIYGWLIGALVVCALVAGGTYKGYEAGADHERTKQAKAQEAARAEADAARKADQDAARKSAQNLQAALTRQRTLARDLGTSLEAHIRAMPAPRPDCPAPALTSELLDDINRALAGGAGAAGNRVPDAGGTVANPDGPKLPSANPPAR